VCVCVCVCVCMCVCVCVCVCEACTSSAANSRVGPDSIVLERCKNVMIVHSEQTDHMTLHLIKEEAFQLGACMAVARTFVKCYPFISHFVQMLPIQFTHFCQMLPIHSNVTHSFHRTSARVFAPDWPTTTVLQKARANVKKGARANSGSDSFF
jgi:hypothetical protein